MAYSFSQIQSYLACPLRYRYEKIDKIKPEIQQESLHLILGTTVHETLENLYKQVGNLKIPEIKDLQEDFNTIRKRELEKVNKIHGEGYFENETLENFFARGEKYIQRYYTNYHPFDQAISMKTEDNINFEIEEGLKFRGKIDRLDIQQDTMTITDYKTSRSLPKDWSNSIEEQITLYGIGIQQDYGKQIKKIIWKVIYLHLEKEYQREITQEKITETKQKYLAIMHEIEEKKEQYLAGDEETFEAKSWYQCQYCSFLQICPLYKHQYLDDEKLKEEEVKSGNLASTTIRKLIEEYALIQEKFKQIDAEKKLFAQILTEYANTHNCKKLYSENYKLSIANKESYSLNKNTLEQLEEKLEKLGILSEMQSIDYHKLGKQFKENKLSYDDYQDFVNKKISSYISRVSEIKKKEE